MPAYSTCVVCAKSIKHHPAHVRITCSMTCRSEHVRRLYAARQYRPSPQAFVARAASAKRRVEAATVGQFGAMSKREVDIFNHGVKVGYRKGYHRASSWLRKEAA